MPLGEGRRRQTELGKVNTFGNLLKNKISIAQNLWTDGGREGENICRTEELESHMVNTTYLESVKVSRLFHLLGVR